MRFLLFAALLFPSVTFADERDLDPAVIDLAPYEAVDLSIDLPEYNVLSIDEFAATEGMSQIHDAEAVEVLKRYGDEAVLFSER